MRLLIIIFLSLYVSVASVKKSQFIDQYKYGKPLPETSLEGHRLSAVYRNRLDKGWAILRAWAEPLFTDWAWTWDAGAADFALARFVQHCHDNDIALWLARHALLAVQRRFRHLRHRLPRAWEAIEGWQLVRPLSHRRPIPMEVLRAAFGQALFWGFENHLKLGPLWLVMGVLLRVGYFGLLRTSELLNLLVGDVKFIMNHRTQKVKGAILALRDPKGRRTLGRAQFAMIRDKTTARWLQWLVAELPAKVKIWPTGNPRFGVLFQQLLFSIGIPWASSSQAVCDLVGQLIISSRGTL